MCLKLFSLYLNIEVELIPYNNFKSTFLEFKELRDDNSRDYGLG